MLHNSDYTKYELEKAHNALRSAKILYDAEDFNGSANRAYYAAFHAVTALLSDDGIFRSKHSGIVSEFRKQYIKTGLLDTELSNKIGKLKDIREDCDYETFFVVSKSETAEQIENAKDIINAVENYLERKINRVQNIQQKQPLRNDLIEQQQQNGYATSAPHTPQTNNYAAEELKVDDPKQAASLPKKKQGTGGRHI